MTRLSPHAIVILTALLAIGLAAQESRDAVARPGTGTVTDVEGNGYRTVTIGTQVWMAENPRTAHFRNGRNA